MLAATIVVIFSSIDNFLGAVTANLPRPQRRGFCHRMQQLLRQSLAACRRTSWRS